MFLEPACANGGESQVPNNVCMYSSVRGSTGWFVRVAIIIGRAGGGKSRLADRFAKVGRWDDSSHGRLG